MARGTTAVSKDATVRCVSVLIAACVCVYTRELLTMVANRSGIVTDYFVVELSRLLLKESDYHEACGTRLNMH